MLSCISLELEIHDVFRACKQVLFALMLKGRERLPFYEARHFESKCYIVNSYNTILKQLTLRYLETIIIIICCNIIIIINYCSLLFYYYYY